MRQKLGGPGGSRSLALVIRLFLSPFSPLVLLFITLFTMHVGILVPLPSQTHTSLAAQSLNQGPQEKPLLSSGDYVPAKIEGSKGQDSEAFPEADLKIGGRECLIISNGCCKELPQT